MGVRCPSVSPLPCSMTRKVSDSMSERRSVALVQFAGLQPVPALARFSLRGDLSQLEEALSPAGVRVSRVACRAIEGDLCAALWLGPDEQLVLAADQRGAQLAETLATAMASVPHSL